MLGHLPRLEFFETVVNVAFERRKLKRLDPLQLFDTSSNGKGRIHHVDPYLVRAKQRQNRVLMPWYQDRIWAAYLVIT